MAIQKFSISLPRQQCEFIEHYKTIHDKSRSEVIKEALLLLQKMQLAAYYKEANKEIDPDFDNTTSDGIEDNEAW